MLISPMLLKLLSLLFACFIFIANLILGDRVYAATALPCSATGGTWKKGELNIYVFDVEQGDSMLVIGPNAKTVLIDLGETRFNTTGADTNASRIAARIRSICGTGQNPVFLDYFIASHLHLDHIGYAANPGDTTNYGNGIYQLLNPPPKGIGFKVGQYITRDAGRWVDRNGNKRCEPGTSTQATNEIAWTNVGTISTTATRNLCWLYGPPGQPDRANIEGKVVTLTTNGPWPTIDLGSGAKLQVINVNGKGSTLIDGVTPVSGDYSRSSLPPSENDYSIAVKISYGKYVMASAGDTDGVYRTSEFGYTYNDIETRLGGLYGNVDTYRVNHHGSSNSSNPTFINTLKPETAIFSCGSNSYGHPSNSAINTLRAVRNDRGTGADMFLTNNPCSPTQSDGSPTNYAGMFGSNGDIIITTNNKGSSYTISYPGGSKTYTAYGGGGAGSDEVADASKIVINEYMMAPSFGNEWVELYNPTNSPISIGGLFIDDIPNGGAAPKAIPAGASIPPKGFYVVELSTSFLNNTGSEEVRFLKISNGVETVYDKTSYNLSSTRLDSVFYRTGNTTWCNVISTRASRGASNPTTCP